MHKQYTTDPHLSATISDLDDDLPTLVVSSGLPPYGRFPRWLCQSNVSDASFRFFCYLTEFMDLPHGIVRSRKRMAEDLNWSTRKIDRCRSELEELGALTIVPRFLNDGDQPSKQTTNQYILHYDKPHILDDNGPGQPPGDNAVTGGVTDLSPKSIITSSYNNTHRQNEQSHILASDERDYPTQPCPPDNYVTTLFKWAAKKNYRTPTIIDDPLPLYRFAMDVLDTEADKKNTLGKQRYLLCALQVINDYWEEMYGVRLSPVQIRHLRTGIARRGGACVLDALAKAIEWGAGLTNGYENDPLAVMKYALGIIRKGDAEAKR